jgi:hypothetical protein
MIAAVRQRIGAVFAAAPAASVKWTRRIDRAANRGLERAHPTLLRAKHRSTDIAKSAWAWSEPRLRPAAALFFRGLAAGDRAARRGAALAVRAATAASRVVTPRRAIAAVILAAGIGLVVSQFIDYRGVEIGQPGYADLPGSVAQAPMVQIRTAGQAHAYLLVPLGLLAVFIGALCAIGRGRRLGLGAAGLGLVSIAVILLVDLPSGLDAGAETSRFAGASAVLRDGFYAELAAAAGLVVAGLLYYARPCRIRINSSGRAASARRRRPRRRASSRARVARSA